MREGDDAAEVLLDLNNLFISNLLLLKNSLDLSRIVLGDDECLRVVLFPSPLNFKVFLEVAERLFVNEFKNSLQLLLFFPYTFESWLLSLSLALLNAVEEIFSISLLKKKIRKFNF